MAETFKAEIGAGMSIITLGTIGLLVANFLKNYNSTADVSIFNLSTFCLILSGILMVYNESVIKRPSSSRHLSYFGDKFRKIFSIIGNTLFDFGIILLLFGVGMLLISQFETAYFITNNLFPIIVVLIGFLILNYRYERKF